MQEMRMEWLRPRELEARLVQTPVAYVPLGTLEFHGWHLPLGFDALKAAAICERVAERTGGIVLPPSFFGFSGGHKAYTGSIISEREHVLANLRLTAGRLIDMGARVLVFLTGHYPIEQVEGVKQVAAETMARHEGVTVLALSEAEAVPGEFRGDHAATWETAIALELMPEHVNMEAFAVEEDPLHGICGPDPRTTSSAELGQRAVLDTVEQLAARVQEAVTGLCPTP
jgi:creatinine amidohydrolase